MLDVRGRSSGLREALRREAGDEVATALRNRKERLLGAVAARVRPLPAVQRGREPPVSPNSVDDLVGVLGGNAHPELAPHAHVYYRRRRHDAEVVVVLPDADQLPHAVAVSTFHLLLLEAGSGFGLGHQQLVGPARVKF